MPVPDYEDCPTCVSCGARACVPAASYSKTAAKNAESLRDDIHCAVCGWIFVGTPEQVAQAKKAEEAWNARTDGRSGPWMRVLKARAKKDRGQLRLFDAIRSTERTGGC